MGRRKRGPYRGRDKSGPYGYMSPLAIFLKTRYRLNNRRISSAKVVTMQKSREYQTLLYACMQEGCLLCRLTQENIARYLDTWKYELFTDVDVRKELQRTRGFCNQHTWQLVHMGATLQLAQAYRDIITDLTEQLQNEAGVNNATGLFRRSLKNGNKREPEQCPACHRKEEAENRYIHTLRQVLLDPDFYRQFEASHGLCLPHFQLSCTLKLPDISSNWLSLLRKAELICLQRLDEQLQELIRKHDYRFKDEARGDEMSSWKRAAGIVAGEEE